MAYVVVLIVLAGALFLISAPLRADHRELVQPEAARIAELEAARDAKYREIRDAELDLRTGKLSEEDYEAIDQTLRSEAIEIMRALDAVGADGHEA
jgi:flagellar biosynthesis/type III secretory pathway M-ring protein FliF/YscJ